MSKAISYYDWQQSFKNNSESNKYKKEEKSNSIGINENSFKNFVKKWKEKNLS